MKRVLIISPYFVPSNAADMQRVRMSLPYFKDLGWDAEVVCVDPKHSEMVKDPLLLQSLPAGQVTYQVEAFNKKWTGKLGLGSLALRSMWFYFKAVNKLLRHKKYDVIYFSTTQFPVTILGRYWKRNFRVPYVIDMQDPWHSDYYRDKPKKDRPKKYWFSYRLNKWLEPVAMKAVDGLISVSHKYIADLKERYPQTKDVPESVITFGYLSNDLHIAESNKPQFKKLLGGDAVNVVYIGRGGADMHKAVAQVFSALKKGLNAKPLTFSRLKFYFIGTSYAPKGQGRAGIAALATEYGVSEHVVEITDRISYYHTLNTLQQADALFVPGSDDPKYTASKLYPYMLTQKPLLAIFQRDSGAINVLKGCTYNANVFTLDQDNTSPIYNLLERWATGIVPELQLTDAIEDFDARNLTIRQVDLLEQAIAYAQRTH